MNEKSGPLDPSRKLAALKKLAEQLSSLATGEEMPAPMEMDMLSLIVDGALHGEDIARRYPAFYQKLLENAGLRQAFLDALDAIESERTETLIPMPAAAETRLDFLTRQPPAPVIEISGNNNWRVTWQRTLEQVRAIFSPPEMAYRADQSDLEEPWFTLLREEMRAGGSIYTVVLDCTPSVDSENSLAAYLHLAVTLEASAQRPAFPLHARLRWGEYNDSVPVLEEGRVRFPDVPLASVFDVGAFRPEAGFSLSLEMY